jgi:hypothetical protein
MAFWFGVVLLGVLGSCVTFYPGAETGWFGVTAIFIACGFFGFIRRKRAPDEIGHEIQGIGWNATTTLRQAPNVGIF